MSNAKILVVDDDPSVIIFVVDQLEHMGFDVLIARDGIKGLQIAQQKEPDLIVLDVMMPGMNGFDVCHALKKEPNTWVIPILMLTSKSQKSEIVRGLELGADDYLTKPYNKEEFEARIKALLRRFPPASSKENSTENFMLARLHENLLEGFDLEELRTLCIFKLGIDYESLLGEGKAAKARELIMHLKRRGKISELVKVGKELRSNLNWSN